MNTKTLIKFCCGIFVIGAWAIPVDSTAQEEEAPKCYVQSITLSDGRTGLACMMALSSMSCQPCGAFDEDPIEDPTL